MYKIVVGAALQVLMMSYLPLETKAVRADGCTATQLNDTNKGITQTVSITAHGFHWPASRDNKGDVTLLEKKRRRTKIVAVSGTPTAEHPFASKIGELIASKGFDLVTGGTSGGNLNKVREAFSKKKTDEQKSFWAPNMEELAEVKVKFPNTGKPADVDESVDPVGPGERPQITKADMVIVLPGGRGVVVAIEEAKQYFVECFGVLNKDDDLKDDGTPKAKLVKDALEKNGFKYVNDMDWDKDSKAIESFLDEKAQLGGEQSSVLNIFPGSAFAIITLGLFVVI